MVYISFNGIRIANTDGINNLLGGEFAVFRDEECTEQVGDNLVFSNETINEDNIVYFYGLDNTTTYYLKQVKAPTGFKLFKETIALIPDNYEDDGDDIESINNLNESDLNQFAFQNSYKYNQLNPNFDFYTYLVSTADMPNVGKDGGLLTTTDSGGKPDKTTSNYYYADDVSYDNDTGKYTLINPQQKTTTTYADLEKKYTCRFTTDTSCSEVIMYIKIYNSNPNTINNIFTISFANGHRLDDPENYIVFGNSIDYSNNQYHLSNTYTLNFTDLVDEKQNIKNYRYTCFNNSDSCSKAYYIISDISEDYIASLDDENFFQQLGISTHDNLDVEQINQIETTLAKSTDFDYIASILTFYIFFERYGLFSNERTTYSAYTFVLQNGLMPNDMLNMISDTQRNGSNDSAIKSLIDTWSSQNINRISNNKSIFEDTVFCEDHTMLNKPNGNLFNYGPASRINLLSLDCPSNHDRYTVSSNIGNGLLTYPVGNITIDEIRLTAWPDYADSNFWTMSPVGLYEHVLKIYNSTGHKIAPYVKLDVKPVVSLAPNIKISSGTGYANDPYIIYIY